MYRATTRFVDLQDSGYVYRAGDIFPRSGVVVGKERIECLLGTNNKRGIQLITECPGRPTEGNREQDPGVGPSVAPTAKRKPRKRKEE